MKKFEYKRFTNPMVEEIIPWLNKLGNAGWKVVHIGENMFKERIAICLRELRFDGSFPKEEDNKEETCENCPVNEQCGRWHKDSLYKTICPSREQVIQLEKVLRPFAKIYKDNAGEWRSQFANGSGYVVFSNRAGEIDIGEFQAAYEAMLKKED